MEKLDLEVAHGDEPQTAVRGLTHEEYELVARKVLASPAYERALDAAAKAIKETMGRPTGQIDDLQ